MLNCSRRLSPTPHQSRGISHHPAGVAGCRGRSVVRAKMRMGSAQRAAGHDAQGGGQRPAHADSPPVHFPQKQGSIQNQQGTQRGFIQFARIGLIFKMIHIGTDDKPDFTRAAFLSRMPFQHFREGKSRMPMVTGRMEQSGRAKRRKGRSTSMACSLM